MGNGLLGKTQLNTNSHAETIGVESETYLEEIRAPVGTYL